MIPDLTASSAVNGRATGAHVVHVMELTVREPPSEEPTNRAEYCENVRCSIYYLPPTARDARPSVWPCIVCGARLVSVRYGPLEPDERLALAERAASRWKRLAKRLHARARRTST